MKCATIVIAAIIEDVSMDIIAPDGIGIIVNCGAFELISCVMMGWTRAKVGARF